MAFDFSPDYWYIHRHDIEIGDIFQTKNGDLVKIDAHVPGDGTKLYVADWCGTGWSYQDNTIEPGELWSAPLNRRIMEKVYGF